MADAKLSALYCDPDADVIFRSCDAVDFRLHKLILHKASPVFRDMFGLPEDPAQRGIPQTVAMTEDAMTLQDLLSFCYPFPRPDFQNLDRLLSVLRASLKYDMAFLVGELGRHLKLFVPAEPLRVYAIAYTMLDDADLARAAAKQLLHDPLFSDPLVPPPEFDSLPARALSIVGAYRRQCIVAAQTVLLDFDWMMWAWLSCPSCARGASGIIVHKRVDARERAIWPRAWWQTYADAVAKELALRPVGAVVTRIELMRPAVEEAAKCTTCAPRAMVDLVEYANAMAKRIDEATSKVRRHLSRLKFWNAVG
ncbi:uncharacterized protein TRAVEDRAFT_112862 [Trametes versicolor FP-101664 SS1]|uniref:uncharacterized protein n=1 Tax=Trametes versicolor (strain FP-101664) TaxID=717944 RepID=UPI0004622DF6|nr:uncharacterized protein TRAVEDRAFT_112862 [Trametes versicolor FP-101664 SS1]EIW63242.1 hypothetical protein TRAVEDRAFT_112862 [Trametes versicolor FP-101664 SS1]